MGEEAMEQPTPTPTPPPPPIDLSLNAKGKRTKRLRPLSPIPLTIIPFSPGFQTNVDNMTKTNHNTASGGLGGATPCEDEDMANCLILLSQGHCFKPPSNQADQILSPGADKFNSKIYMAGIYMYQCKTCGRTFPSFQALGGHRASHNKPKNISDNDEELKSPQFNNYRMKKPPALSLDLFTRGHYTNFSNSPGANKSPMSLGKIHECNHCGAEFGSGQALGGHMRRHRGVAQTAPTTPSTTLSLSPIPISPASIDQESDQEIGGNQKRKNGLSLDLNLPAPEDEQEKESAIVLSTRRLICD